MKESLTKNWERIQEIKSDNLDLQFYVVRSRDGMFFRSKGFNGYGDSWVKEITKAKVYSKIGAAKGQVTFWATNYPDFGIPDIIVLSLSATKVIDESDRVRKTLEKKLKEAIKNVEDYKQKYPNSYSLERAQKDVEKLQKTLKCLE